MDTLTENIADSIRRELSDLQTEINAATVALRELEANRQVLIRLIRKLNPIVKSQIFNR